MALFADEHTHTTPEGAKLNAQCVVEGLRALKNCPLVKLPVPGSRMSRLSCSLVRMYLRLLRPQCLQLPRQVSMDSGWKFALGELTGPSSPALTMPPGAP